MMKESDMKPLISKKTGLFIDVENDEEDVDEAPLKDYGFSTFATFVFIVFFIFSGIYMAWYTWYACYELCATSHTKPNNLLDEKCYFIVHANYGKPNERLIKKYNGSKESFHLKFMTSAKLRNDFYQPDPQMCITIIYTIAIAAFIVRLYFLSKKPHYVLDYFCISVSKVPLFFGTYSVPFLFGRYPFRPFHS